MIKTLAKFYPESPIFSYVFLLRIILSDSSSITFSVKVITWFQNRRAKFKRVIYDFITSFPNDAVKV